MSCSQCPISSKVAPCAWREKKNQQDTTRQLTQVGCNLPMVWLHVGHQARGSCISLHTGGFTLLPPRHHAKLESEEPSAPSFPCPLLRTNRMPFQALNTKILQQTPPHQHAFLHRNTNSLKQVGKCPAKFLSFPEGQLWCFLYEISKALPFSAKISLFFFLKLPLKHVYESLGMWYFGLTT